MSRKPASSPSSAPAFGAPFVILAVDDVRESPTNPRRHVDDEKFAELVENVRSMGVLQPVLARPIGDDKFELVYGHRRFRAAKAAGLKEIPANVRTLDDRAVLEIQLVENAQRADIHPLDEADGFRRLHKDHGLSVDEIHEKTGKSKAYIYGRMKLCELSDEKAREAFLDGTLVAETALLIARLPPKLQKEATEDVLRSWDHESQAFRPMSSREAADWIQTIQKNEHLVEVDPMEPSTSFVIDQDAIAAERASKKEAERRARERLDKKLEADRAKEKAAAAKTKQLEEDGHDLTTEEGLRAKAQGDLALELRKAVAKRVASGIGAGTALKLLQVFIASGLEDYKFSHEDEDGGLNPKSYGFKMPKEDATLGDKLAIVRAVPQKKFLAYALEEVMADVFSRCEDGVYLHRPDEALEKCGPIADLFNVNTSSMRKKAEAWFVEQVKKHEREVEESNRVQAPAKGASKAKPKKAAKKAKK